MALSVLIDRWAPPGCAQQDVEQLGRGVAEGHWVPLALSSSRLGAVALRTCRQPAL